MADINKLVSRFIIEEITLFSKDVSASAKSREWFLTRLQNTIQSKLDSGESIPQLYSSRPFVKYGSYFKGTKVRNVDEFDVLVVLDSNSGQFTDAGTVVGKGKGVCNPCYKYLKKYYKSDDSGVSPSKLLNWLQSVVKEIVDAFGGETPVRAGQAVTATIKSKDLKLDLVPAGVFTRTEDPNRVFYDIPKGDKNNGWILTAPQEDIELIRSYAADRQEFKNIIRIIKSIRSDYNLAVSSFAVECSVIWFAAENQWTQSVANNLYLALQDFAQRLRQGSILDTWNNTNNLIDYLGVNEWYADRMTSICQLMYDLQTEEDEQKAYVKLLRKLRNDA
jgi:hypothetical protein